MGPGFGLQPHENEAHDRPDAKLVNLWRFALVVSLLAVTAFFVVVNLSKGINGAPLGYDTYYYLGYIQAVVANGPLAFAASQHYVEFLYPIVASIPVYLGLSANTIEVLLPPILACLTVLAVGYLGLMSKDTKLAALSIAFASGWFALYRMGADFHANLLAFPIILFASVFILKVRRDGRLPVSALAIFMALVLVAGATHIETTDFFIAVWAVCFVLLGRGVGRIAWRESAVMVAGAVLITSPLDWAYLSETVGSLGSQYCVFPPYWLQVFGVAIVFTGLGLLILVVSRNRNSPGGDYRRFLLTWSLLALVVGTLGYLFSFPIGISDRVLLLFPVPFVSAVGLLWLLNRARFHGSQILNLLTLLVVVIPVMTVPAVYSYTVPNHYRYFASHNPSLVECVPGNPSSTSGEVQPLATPSSLASHSSISNSTLFLMSVRGPP